METGPEFKIEVSILKGVATVMIDTTGSNAQARTWIVRKGWSTVKENMAAAVYSSRWYQTRLIEVQPVVEELSVSGGGYDC